MAYTAGFSVSVGDPTKASDVTTLAANDDYLKAAVDALMADSATPTSVLKDGVTATTQSSSDNSTKVATTAYVDASSTAPGGSNTQVQYNNSGAFGASANLKWDSNTLVIAGSATIDAVPVVSSPGPYGDGSDGAISNITDADFDATTVAQSGTIALTSNRIIRATTTVTLSQAITVGQVTGRARGSYSVVYGGPGIELGAILAALGSKGIPVPMGTGGATAGSVGGIVQIIAGGNVVVGGTITAVGAAGSGDGGGGGGLVVIISGGEISGASAIDVSGGTAHATPGPKGGGGGYSGEPGGHAGYGGSGGGMGGSYWTYGGSGSGGGSSGGAGILTGGEGGRGYGNPNRTGGGGGCLDEDGANGGSGGMGYGLLAQYGSQSPPTKARAIVATSGAGGHAGGTNGGGGGGGPYPSGAGGAGTALGGSGGGGGAEGNHSWQQGNGGNGGTGGLLYAYSSDSPYAGMPGGMGGGGGGGVGYFGTASGGAANGTPGSGAVGAAGKSPIVAGVGSGAGGAGGTGDTGGPVESTYFGAMGGNGGKGGNGGGAAGLCLMIGNSITYSGTVTGRHIKIDGADAEEFIRGLLTYG